ncbi:head fiber protein [Faecalicatena contorta]|uniref:head fiber protein n=1 Tax=Faecalicatena contorta TaxID=39482 RepID=UPI001FAFED24|nr:head fiber protein [Faecalicatena contorta]
MDEKKFLNLNGLSSFLTNLKKIFATAAQGTKADSAYTHAQSAHAPSNAERNIVVGIQKNGSDLTPNSSSRKVNITVPTKVSELTNDSGYKTTDTTYENATTSTDGLMSSEDKTKLDGIATGANKYVHPSYTSKASGLYKVTVDSTGHVSATSAVAKSDITALGIPGSDTNTWIALKGATTSAAGTAGYVPAPAAGAANRYLRSDGTWTVPPDTNTTYSVATTSANGLMSSADKSKLDGIAAGANKYTLPTASSSTLGGVKTTSAVTSTSGLTPCPIISGVPYYKDTNTTYSLSSFGITATAAELNKLDGCTATVGELNYVHGVTSAIQTQLNAKAASNHTHSGYAASSHNHSAANITSGTLPVARGGTGGTTAATARTGIGAINTVCQTTEPTTQNTGDFWFREV